jgi:ferredoxin-NADP reductase
MKRYSTINDLQFSACRIESIKILSDEFFQIYFYSKSPVWEDYLPGQFLTLNFNNNYFKCWITTHHFGGELPSIIISKKCINNIKKGDELLLSKAEGNFTLNPVSNYKRSFLFLAQDEGIFPIYCMLKSLLYIENMSKASIYVINKSNDQILYDEIDFLKNMVHGRICCELEVNKKTFSIHKLNNLYGFTCKIQTPIIYVCGGKAFINKTADFALKKKIPLSNLQYFKTPLN